MALFQNLFGPPQPPGMTPAAPALPAVPWKSNPMITTAALSLLGGRNLNEGLANVAATAGQGMQAKAGLQAFMLAQQEKQAAKSEADARKAQMNDVIKNWSGLSPEQRALFSAQPELFGQYAMGTMTPEKPMVVGKDSQIYDPASKTWTGPPGGGAPDPASITNVTAIRKDLEDEQGTSRYRTSAPILSSMAKSVDNPSAMADLDFVYGMAKIFDPGSVVRESEMGLVIDSQSIPASIKGRLEKVLNGEAVLQPQARRDLVKAAATRVQEYRTQAESEGQFFTDLATRNQINPADVVRPLEPMTSAPGVYTWTPEGGLVVAP